MLKKSFILMCIILFIAFILRIFALDKPLGLWNDEYMAWYISSFPFDKDFFVRMFYNCHMPLYYFFLKAWSVLFGDTDISLRLSSVFIGLLNVISMYFLGKEYKNEKTGLLCALFTTLSAFMIYFSQEVRLYSLIFLFTTWTLFYFVKFTKKQTKINLTFYLLFNFLLIATHTIGFVFAFFNLILFSLYLLKSNPQKRKVIFTIWTIITLSVLPFIPFVFTVLTRDNFSQNWGIFNFSKICFVFVDYFTPILTNITNSPVNLISWLKDLSLVSIICFLIAPLATAFWFVQKSWSDKNSNLIRLFLINAFAYLLILVVASALGKLVLSTKYSIEIFPILILAFCVGLQAIKNKVVKIIFAFAYFIISFYGVTFTEFAPQFMSREEGHKAPAILLKKAQITDEDYIISLYHQFFRYKKYTTLNPEHLLEVDKLNISKYLLGDDCDEKCLKHNGHERLRQEFLGEKTNSVVDEKIESYFKSIPRQTKIAIIVPEQVIFFEDKHLMNLSQNADRYKKTPIMFMSFSYFYNRFVAISEKYCDVIFEDRLGSWKLLVLQRGKIIK